MKNLKDILKKPFFIRSLVGALVLGAGVLLFRNIGLKNQNNYLYNQHKEIGKEYIKLVTKYSGFDNLVNNSKEILKRYNKLSAKYNDLKMSKFMDSVNLSIHYSLEFLSFQKDYIKLIQEDNNLWDEYIIFAKECLEKDLNRKEIAEKLKIATEEKEFYKKYAHYLDSLLANSPLNKPVPDSFFFK